MRYRALLGLTLSLLCTVVACTTHGGARPISGASSSGLVFPAASWEALPASALSPACRSSLDEARGRLQSMPTTAMLVVQNGRILLSYGPVESVSYVASVRKSLLAVLYGKYVENGTIDLDRTIGDLGIDEPDGLLPIEKEARLRDLLTARSGVYHPASNEGDSAASAPPRGSQTPGTYFLYNNWDFNAAGGAFELLTGQSIYQAFDNDLARPLQLEDFDVSTQKMLGDSTRSRYLAYHLWLSTRDLARIGHLMLAQGRWRNQQVVPRDWAVRIVQPVTPSSEMHPPAIANLHLGYGYLWWLFEEPAESPLAGAYTGMGALGQFLLVIPKRQMVIAHKVADIEDPSRQQQVRWKDFLSVARQIAESSCP
jgi:CubicO group peptidase (beta-lactamase class C family)